MHSMHSMHGMPAIHGGSAQGGARGVRTVPSLHMGHSSMGSMQQMQMQMAPQQQQHQQQQQPLGGASNQALLQAVNGMWQDLQAVRLQMDAMRRDIGQLRSDVLRQTGQLTELDGYVRTEVALQGLENRFEPRGGGPSQQATLPTANPMQQVGGSQGGPTWQQQQMSGMGIVGAPGAMGLNPLMQGQSMSSVPPMMGAMPASSSGMAAMAPGGQSGIVGGMSAVSRPQTSGGDGLGPSVSQRGSVAHTSRSAATSVLSIRDLREPSNRGSREDILRTVFDKVDTAGVGKVSFGDLCDYVRSTAKASSGLGALSANIGGTDEDWTGVQRMQCCVFLDRNDGGLMGAFKPFGFDEHSAITWEDFAKFAHRVYEGQGPSRAGSRVETPPTAERGLRPGSKQGKSKRRGGISDRDDGSENSGDEDKSQNRRERRAGSNRIDGDRERTARSRSRGNDGSPHSRASSRRRQLRHEEDSDDGSEEERFTVSSRGPRHRSPARGRIRPRTTSSSRGTRRRIRKRNKRGGRTGGYHTETAMTDASNGYEKSGYNSTGGRRNRGAPDSDSDDAVPTRKAKRRGRKAKGSVKKPPKNLPPGWSAAWDGQYNRYYFYNSKGVVTWDKPAE